MTNAQPQTLRGLTWDHPRAVPGLVAASREFAESRPGVVVEWTARSLDSFERVPLSELAEEFDLISIDHPLLAEGVESGALLPLDDLMSAEVIASRARDAMGRSHDSYRYRERQWALAVDAACQVSAARPDAVEVAPATWDELGELAAHLGRERMIVAANPIHAWCTLLSLCNLDAEAPRQADGRPWWWRDDGFDLGALSAGLDRLQQLLDWCSPASLNLDPIEVYEAMSRGERFDYAPFVFGYVTYATAGTDRRPLRFHDAPSVRGDRVGTVTGGVGLAVSHRASDPRAAAAFLEHVTSPSWQAGGYVAEGGQPASRQAWSSDDVAIRTGGFLRSTVGTMDQAFLRPRIPGGARFQSLAAHELHRGLVDRRPVASIATELTRLWAARDPG